MVGSCHSLTCPGSEMSETVTNRLRQQILSARESGATLTPVGGGTKAFYGNRGMEPSPSKPQPLSTHELTGIVAYEPSELVVVARSGTRLSELESALAERGQMLGFEPPHFGPGATIGGCVAAGLSGPRRMAAGAVRDFVLGVRLLDSNGLTLSFGGQVMKNVAGYDVARLMAGSLGTLGLLTEVSLKVLPCPAAESTLHVPMTQAEALLAFDRWSSQPLPISAMTWLDDVASIRFSGARAAVQAALQELGRGQVAEDPQLAQAFWTALREQTHPFFQGPPASEKTLWRLALPARVAPIQIPGAASTLIEWGGAQRWIYSAADASEVRSIVAGAGGHATRFRSPGASADDVFTALAPALLKIHRNLKNAFDPQGLFNPGRLHPQA
jgi:glycolate oxidase FAD binding subunit